jgi:hypothetical protein
LDPGFETFLNLVKMGQGYDDTSLYLSW